MLYFLIGHVLLYRESAVCSKVCFAVQPTAIGRKKPAQWTGFFVSGVPEFA